MKKKLIYLAVIGLFSFGSCSDSFLNSDPKTDMGEDYYYRTKADAETAIVGCYDGLQRIWAEGVAFPVMSEICSDNTFGGTGNGDGWGYQVLDEFDQTKSPSDRDLFNKNWEAYYNAIYRCNKLLSKINDIDWQGDEAYKTNIEGQARFIRAYLYFDMVRMWENIPLITEPSLENKTQSPVDDVYKLIAEDLKFAADKMNSTPYTASWAKTNDGRVTSWAGKALLGRVFLFYTGYYNKEDLVGVTTKTEVLSGLEDVVANGGYTPLTDYATMWPGAAAYQKNKKADNTAYAGKGNSETVFAVKYNYTSNYDGRVDGNQWLIMLGLRNTTVFPYAKGWGACTVNQDLWNAFDPADKRKSLSIIGIVEEGITPDVKDQRDYTGYTNKKYTPLSTYDKNGNLIDEVEALGAVNFMIGQYQDYVSIRITDVKLMAAELGSASAQQYLDDVRARAGLSSKPVSKATILEERRFEFAFEGIRYWDLLRQGVTVAADAIAINTTVQNGGANVPKQISASKIIETRGFQQIPEDQILKSNNVLKQNKGWE